MFLDKTVFVIGAGASAEFGLPIGSGLMRQIKENCRFRFQASGLLEGAYPIFRELAARYADVEARNKRYLACAEINRAIDTSGSIDAFIDRNADDEFIAEMGKLQIAYAISIAEQKSKLKIVNHGNDNDLDWNNLEDTWITPFIHALFDRVRASEVDAIGRNITIICFNYDRCIEHCLTKAIRRSFRGIDSERAYKIVSNINIIHPYGSLGTLPNQYSVSISDATPFGPDHNRTSLYKMSEGLVTWSETVRDQTAVAQIKRAMAEAHNVVFLGFGFASQNMELLECADAEQPARYKQVYASGFGIPRQVEDTLKAKIASLFKRGLPNEFALKQMRIEFELKCFDFMKTHLMNIMR